MAWTGKTTYDHDTLIGQDMSEFVVLAAARETPLLELLGDAPFPARSTTHEWADDLLAPDKLINSTAVNSATAATGIQINGYGNQLQVGMLLQVEDSANGELVQIASVPGPNSILVNRNIGSGGVSSLAPGGTIFVIGTAEQEGSETSGDTHIAPVTFSNYTQIFKKPVTVTGTAGAVSWLPDLGDAFDVEAAKRTIELMKELEKSAIRGVKSGSTSTAATNRTFGGIRSFLTTINSQVTNSSFTANPLLYLNDVMQQCWNRGMRDLDAVLLGGAWKRYVSDTNASKLYIEQQDQSVVRKIEMIQTDFGMVRAIVSPYMHDNSALVIASRYIRVVPLKGRSFFTERLAKTGDNSKGHVLGEYTLEIHHPDKQAHLRAS